MDKQHFDHIEDRIRQAAENVSPPFREEAWKKMEELLDKELSHKRRPGIVWWPIMLLVLIIGSGIVYYVNDQGEKAPVTKPTQSFTQKETKKTTNSSKLAQPATDQSATNQPATDRPANAPSLNHSRPVPTNIEENREQVSGKPQQALPQPVQTPGKPASLSDINANNSGNRQRQTAVPSSTRTRRNAALTGSSENKQTEITGKQDEPGNSVPVRGKTADVVRETAVDSASKTADTDKRADTEKQETTEAAHTENTESIKPAGNKNKETGLPVKENKEAKQNPVKLSQRRTGIYVVASVAADASNIDKWSVNNRQTVFGAGIGYQFNKRFALQTGFYAGRKKYTAGPGDYKTEPGSYWSMVDIQSIDANCFIYEIPLSLRYNLMQKNSFNVYAVGGISSVIMKKETYGYHYKRTGTYHWAERTYTGNKNFLSMVDLSIGFEHKIHPALFLQAEPYLKMPVSGIGEGKIKLYSAGLQVGIRYQPLRKKNFK